MFNNISGLISHSLDLAIVITNIEYCNDHWTFYNGNKAVGELTQDGIFYYGGKTTRKALIDGIYFNGSTIELTGAWERQETKSCWDVFDNDNPKDNSGQGFFDPVHGWIGAEPKEDNTPIHSWIDVESKEDMCEAQVSHFCPEEDLEGASVQYDDWLEKRINSRLNTWMSQNILHDLSHKDICLEVFEFFYNFSEDMEELPHVSKLDWNDFIDYLAERANSTPVSSMLKGMKLTITEQPSTDGFHDPVHGWLAVK